MLKNFLSYRQAYLNEVPKPTIIMLFEITQTLGLSIESYDTSGEGKLITTSVMYYQRVKIWLMMIMKWFCGMVD